MKSRKIRTFIPEDTSIYANPYISFPAERNIDNTKSSFDLRYNKNYKVNSKRVFTISSEYRDIDRAIKPDLLHPSTLDRILTMENQDGTTACADLLNQTDKKYQHKRSNPKKHYYAVTKTATIAADIGIPTSEDAKVTKVLATSPMQLEKMLFKDYYGTRVGRKNSPPELHVIYNFDNWLQVRVCREDNKSVVGQTTYFYNPSEMRPLEMNAFAKTVWTQKSVYVPVRFGTDVKPESTSQAIVPANSSNTADINTTLNNWQTQFFNTLNNWGQAQQAQPAQQAQDQTDRQYPPYEQRNEYSDDYSGFTVEDILPENDKVYKPQENDINKPIKLTVSFMRNLLRKIWIANTESYASKAEKFINVCKENNWDADEIFKTRQFKNKIFDDYTQKFIRLLCNPLYRDYDENWWNEVKTPAHITRTERTEKEPIPNIHRIATPPQNETVSLDQQAAQQTAEQTVQQPAQTVVQPTVQQQTVQQEQQPVQSVFTEQQPAQPAEQATEQPAEQATEQAVEQQQLTPQEAAKQATKKAAQSKTAKKHPKKSSSKTAQEIATEEKTLRKKKMK